MCDFDIIEQISPSYIYFSKLDIAIAEYKEKFQSHKETINKNSIKCIFLGNTAVGKSTVINALLGENVVNNDVTEGTICVTQCQATDRDVEYFNLKSDTNVLKKEIEISELKFICKRFQHLRMSPDINRLVDVYLDKSKYSILQNNLALVDCPSYNNNEISMIMKFCGNGDIFVFCFDIKDKITDKEFAYMKDIMKQGEKFKFIVLFTKCDNNNKLNINAEREDIIKKFQFEKDSIFFISGLEESTGSFDCERHREFINFRKHLEDSSKALKMGIRNEFLEVIIDLTSIIKCMSSIIPKIPIENSENFNNVVLAISENIDMTDFGEMDQNIKKSINNITTVYYKDDSIEALSKYSDSANREITQFLIKIFLKNTSIEDAPNLFGFFHNQFIQSGKIEKMEFSRFDSGSKRTRIKKHIFEYYERNKFDIYSMAINHYKEKVQKFFNEWIKFKDNVKNLISELELKSL